MCLTEVRGGVYPHASYRGPEEDVPPYHGYRDEGGPEVAQAQTVAKNFVRSLVRGLPVTVLSVTGGTAECIAFLDRGLTTLSLQRAGKLEAKRRIVPLEEISEVVVGEYGGQDFNLSTDTLCVTLVFETGQAVSFRFENDEERDTFALCLSMFVDGRRNELARAGGVGLGPRSVAGPRGRGRDGNVGSPAASLAAGGSEAHGGRDPGSPGASIAVGSPEAGGGSGPAVGGTAAQPEVVCGSHEGHGGAAVAAASGTSNSDASDTGDSTDRSHVAATVLEPPPVEVQLL